jgi:hypothetical protein
LRSYSSAAVAVALRVTPKWVDNLLSHHQLPGVERGRQGVERRISDRGLLAIQLVRVLVADLAISTARASEIAAIAMDSRNAVQSTVTTPSGIALVLPLAEIERRLREQVVEAVEMVAERPRGRPPRLPRG